MKRTTILIFLFALLLAALMNAQELVDTVMAGRIRAEGFEHSQVMDVFDHLVNVIGPRLTASPAYQTAVTWTRDRLVNMGFDNVHLEPWEFGRGWQVERISVEMLEPRYMPMIAYASGWSPSTNGKIVAAPVWLGNTEHPVSEFAGKIAGSIVMSTPIQEDFERNDRTPAVGDFRRQSLLAAEAQQAQRQRAQEVTAALQKEKPGVTLTTGLGEQGTVFVK